MVALLLVKVSVLLAAALGAAWLLRRTAAVTRHGIWSLTFASLLALPMLAGLLPALEVPVPAVWRPAPSSLTGIVPVATERGPTAPADAAADGPAASSGPESVREASRVELPRFFALTPAAALIAIWGLGTLLALSALVVSLVRVRRLAATGAELTDAGWRDAADAMAARLGCRGRARLLLSDRVRTPMAGGLARSTIFLPASAAAWTAERRDVVLAHELAHLAGGDPLRHVAARVAVALYWFHPLAWIAAREASVAREQACDEAVLALGTRPSTYAQVLLDFADAAPARPLAALPIVERSLLERRLMAILTDDERVQTRPRPLIPAAAIAILALGVAAARPAAHEPPRDRPAVEATAVPAPVLPQVSSAAATSCRAAVDLRDGQGFRGSMSSSGSGASTVIYDMNGTRGGDRIILRSFGDLQLCMVAEGFAGADPSLRPSEWPGRARRVVVESTRAGAVQRLETTRGNGGAQQVVWKIGGVERPFDAAAQAWREGALAVLDTTWEISSMHGEVSSLRGEISSLRGEESGLRGEISSLRGEVSSMRGQISSVRGDESSLRGRISSILGDVSSLRGQISSEQGAISSLNAQRYGADDAERTSIATRIRRHEAEIARIEKEIRDFNADAKIADVERQIRALETEKKTAAIESEIRAFDVEGRARAIERHIAELDVAGKTAAIERKIAALEVDQRKKQLDERLAGELRRLQDAIARVR